MVMKLYTWGGIYFGMREENELWTHDGRHVGRFRADEVYDSDGNYLGEMKNGKLIKKSSKRSKSAPSFSPHTSRVGHVPSVNQVGRVMVAGYEDFPSPDEI
jgi:hypothetical protein